MNEDLTKNRFLFLGISLTIIGCIICALGIALPAWQVIFTFLNLKMP